MNRKNALNIFGYLLFFISIFLLSNFDAINTKIIYADSNIEDLSAQSEDGWRRYDDENKNISYTGAFSIDNSNSFYNNCAHSLTANSSNYSYQYITFSFYGNKIRLSDFINSNKTKGSEISLDGGQSFERCSAYSEDNRYSKSQAVYYENTNLDTVIHDVIIRIPYEEGKIFNFDYVEFNKDGYLISHDYGGEDSDIKAHENENSGQAMSMPQQGWKRYDDCSDEFVYSGGVYPTSNPDYCAGSCHKASQYNSKMSSQYIKFSFIGKNLRIINSDSNDKFKDCLISFDDGRSFEVFSQKDGSSHNKFISYEKTGMDFGIHNVIIKVPYDEQGGTFSFDAVDIDEEGSILPEFYTSQQEEDSSSIAIGSMGDIQDIITALINKDEFEKGDTNEDLKLKIAQFIKTYDDYIINNN